MKALAGQARTVVHDARAVLQHARASVVASGTATVEAALIGNPFVVVYRVSRITYAVAKRVVSVAHVGMVNLIAGRRIVPELIQHDFTASKGGGAAAPVARKPAGSCNNAVRPAHVGAALR